MERAVNFGIHFLKLSNELTSTVWKGFSTMGSSKLPRLVKKIGTHNGMFHCDEALACFMLKQLPEYADAEIVRTRDPKILDTCDIVVDVGAEYDPKRNRFDHHQKSFQETLHTIRPELTKNKFNNIRLSSAGLVYAHFGLEILSEILAQSKLCKKLADSECLKNLFLYIYEGFVEELDAIDNGVPMYPEGKPRYKINTHLSARVHRLNPAWNSLNEDTDQLFEKAVALVGSEFKEHVIDGISVWWPAREIVKKSIENRKSVYKTGEIMLLVDRCSWKDHLHILEEEMNISGEIKFCVFHDKTSDTWRIQGIPIQPDSFICRVFLHKNWLGVRDEELSTVAGIENCIFCHSTGFIGGNKTKEGALQMAIQSLNAASVDRE
ncbi:UPF0160 protein [Sitophilus oryzae]|uniref:UPF0160 protein n=1 Tax=Sitophilus oryzae TaxID=7048 RepID=A0A6J2YLC2_SITOR|nr:UPF0160 protein [Sitophilus oryzae]